MARLTRSLLAHAPRPLPGIVHAMTVYGRAGAMTLQGQARHRRTVLLALTLLAILLPARAAPPAQAALTPVTISMGYIPNVQFAPFYVADARGYYAAAGLKVTFDYASSPDIIRLIGTGSIAFGNAEADQVVLGRTHGLPVTSIFTQYQRYPVVIFALASSDIRSFADLKGKHIGIPGPYGTSYTGLLAALAAAHLSTSEVHIDTIGYSQVAEVAQHRVDAAVGFAPNEPIQLRQKGYAVTVLPVASVAPLAGPGILTSRSLISGKPDLVRRFLQATTRGQRDTDADPAAAFAIARGYMPGIPGAQVALQLAVLREAVRYWTPAAGHSLGCANAAAWSLTQSTLLALHQISATQPASSFYTNQFLSGC
jgi:NitT/TauT family transport system substrate-binding protein